jgi:hypothetical protein
MKKIFFVIAVIFLAGLLGARFFVSDINKENVYWDEVVFLHLAENIKSGEGYTSVIGEEFRPPVFPVLLSLLSNTYFFLTIIVLVSVLLFGYVSARHDGVITGLLSSVLLASLPLYLFWNTKLLAETVVLFEVVLVVYLVHKWVGSRNDLFVYGAGVIAGIAVMTKYQLVMLPVALVLFMWGRERVVSKKIMLVCGIVVITLLPLWVLGVINYAHPLGMFLENRAVVLPYYTPPLFYAQSFFVVFGPFALFSLLAMLQSIKSAKEWGVDVFGVLFFVLYMGFMLFVGQKFARFFIPVVPVVLWFASKGVVSMGKKLGAVRKLAWLVLILVLAMTMAIDGFAKLSDDAGNTRVLLEAMVFVESLDADVVWCNTLPYCLYFGNVLPVEYPDEYDDFLNKNISFAVLDNFDDLPVYADSIRDTSTVLFEVNDSGRFVSIVKRD